MVLVEFITDNDLEDLQDLVNTFITLIQTSDGSIIEIQLIDGGNFIANITYIL